MYFTWKQSVLATYLPGLSNAESSRSGRLVAPITNTSQDLLRPSNSAKSWETTRSMTPPESPDLPLLGARESNSSKKMTQGVALLALSNTVTRCKYMYKTMWLWLQGKKVMEKIQVSFQPSLLYVICIECMYCEKLNCITHAVAELHVWANVQSHAVWHHNNENKYFFQWKYGLQLYLPSLTFCSLWPTYMFISSGPFTLWN